MEIEISAIQKRVERYVEIANTKCTHTDCMYYYGQLNTEGPHCAWMWMHGGQSKIKTFGSMDNVNCKAWEPNAKTRKLIAAGKYTPKKTRKAFIETTAHIRLDEVLAMIEVGMSDKEIANMYHVRVTQFKHWRYEHGIKRQASVAKFDTDEMTELYKKGYSDVEIARVLGCDAMTVRRHRNEKGFLRNRIDIEKL